MKDDDQEITDEELQKLIDKNEPDSGEPGGISPWQRHPWRPLTVISRWIMVLPVSFLAGIGTFYCLMLLNQIFMSGWSEAGLFTRVFVLLINGGASGAAIVYVAFHLAPFRKSETIFVICTLVVLSCGFCIALAVVDSFLPSIVTNASAATGACFVTWRVLSSTK